jgi:hypothetical protein
LRTKHKKFCSMGVLTGKIMEPPGIDAIYSVWLGKDTLWRVESSISHRPQHPMHRRRREYYKHTNKHLDTNGQTTCGACSAEPRSTENFGTKRCMSHAGADSWAAGLSRLGPNRAKQIRLVSCKCKVPFS